MKRKVFFTGSIFLLLTTGMLLSACSANKKNVSKTSENSSDEKSSATTLTLFINHSWLVTDKWEGIIPETITEKTGVRLDCTRAVDDQQLGLLIAADNLPDLIWTASELDRLSNSNLCYSYNELIEKYATDWKPDKMRKTNAAQYSSDGKYYVLLNNFNTQEEWNKSRSAGQLPSIGYRKDLLESVGMHSINSWDDLNKAFSLIKDKYPKIIPYAFNANWKNKAIKCWMGIGEDDFREMSDGSVIHYTDHPKYKDFLKYMNTLYRKGYMSADNFSMTASDTDLLIPNCQVFAYSSGSNGDMWRQGNQAKELESSAEVREISPFSKNTYYTASGTGWAGVFVSKKCEHPDKAIKLLQFMLSEEGQQLCMWGRKGIDWKPDENGLPVFSKEWMDAQNNADLMNTKYNPNFIFGTSAILEANGRLTVLPKDYQADYMKFIPYFHVTPWMTYALPKGDSEEKIAYDKITDYLKNGETKAMLSADDKEFEKNYTELMATLQKMGIKKLEEYMTEHVNAAKKLYCAQ